LIPKQFSRFDPAVRKNGMARRTRNEGGDEINLRDAMPLLGRSDIAGAAKRIISFNGSSLRSRRSLAESAGDGASEPPAMTTSRIRGSMNQA
jgi:hypothetical protein